jgi:hypothetical protein
MGLTLGAIALNAGCTSTSSAPVESTLSTSPVAAADSPVAAAEQTRMTEDSMNVTWDSLLGSAEASGEWQIQPCDAAMLLCVNKNGELAGTIVLGVDPVEGSDVQTWLAAAGVPFGAATAENTPVIDVLKTWVEQYYSSIERDRQTGFGDNIVFSSEEPTIIPLGDLQGLRYEFSTTQADGTVIEHTVGYVTTDGLRLYTISVAIAPTESSLGDGERWLTMTDFQSFEPTWETVLSQLQFNTRL